MTRRILAVDDSPSMRLLLRTSLTAQGFAVSSAEDGEQGLAAARADPPDLIITDINMPVMDGFALIEAVRSEGALKSLPILVLSTEFSDDKKARARAAGATGWITKPFDADKLAAAIRRVCP